MTTSDQDGQRQLTRKQLREIRLTGSTPVITEDQAAAASQPAHVLARAAEPADIAPAPEIEMHESDVPLTRRQIRALEQMRTATDERASDESAPEAVKLHGGLVSGIPAFEPTSGAGVLPRLDEDPTPGSSADASDRDQVAAIFEEPAESRHPREAISDTENESEAPENHASADADELEVITAERPVVGAAFGLGVTPEKTEGALFDDLLDGGSSSGTQHSASTALIFTPSAGAGSLSGPIASTGELLITGTYALPDGIGSHGRAHGTADGKDADAVLLDGELAPASSPTPIAASSAVSTSKSAGEVIRPPAPDKSNKLMLTLAIVAGGLALALAATLIIAATTGVFG